MNQKSLLLLPLLSSLLCGCSLLPITSSSDPTSTSSSSSRTSRSSVSTSIEPQEDYFPLEEITSFYAARGIEGIAIPSIKIPNYTHIEDIETLHSRSYDELKITFYNDISSSYIKAGKALGYIEQRINSNICYVDPSHTIGFHCYFYSSFAHTDLEFFIYQEYNYDSLGLHDYGYEVKEDTSTFIPHHNLATTSNNLKDKSLSPDDITYTFLLGNAWASNYPRWEEYGEDGRVQLKINNQLVMETIHGFQSITFTLDSSKSYGALTADNGSIVINEDHQIIYTGEATKITFTCSSELYFTRIEVIYNHNVSVPPSKQGISTIAEIKNAYEEGRQAYDRYNKTSDLRTLQVKILDRFVVNHPNIDLQGKIFAADSTGAIMMTSSVLLQDEISSYIASKECSYLEVTGYVAYNHTEIEIAIESYRFNSNINKSYLPIDARNFYQETRIGLEDLTEDFNMKSVDESHYRSLSIVKLSNVTTLHYDFYNDMVLCLDQRCHFVYVKDIPCTVHNLDYHSTSLSSKTSYDIYGLEIMLNNRIVILPIEAVELEEAPLSYDESRIIAVNDLVTFAHKKMNSLDEASIYKLECYFSYYGLYKYSVNTSYFASSRYQEGYTTGTCLQDIIDHHSLILAGSYNDPSSLSINHCNNEEEVNAKKKTLYFTLSSSEEYKGARYNRVNVIKVEDIDA